MGCVSSDQIKKPKPKKPLKEIKENYASVYRSKVVESQYATKKSERQYEPLPEIITPPPKFKTITSSQLLNIYEIEKTLNTSSKLQGPKLITHKIDGFSKVLRILNSQKVIEDRLFAYQQILQFELYKDQQQNFLILDELCTGPSIGQVLQPEYMFDLSLSSDKNRQQMLIYGMMLQIYDILCQFHKKGLYLGNLNLFSFQKVSVFDDRIRLVDFCFQENDNEANSIGFAHCNSKKADWQFFGYLLQFFFSNKSPIFISHKMQYIEFQSLPYSQLIIPLLKGRQVGRKQLTAINPINILINNDNVFYGYKFRHDVKRLIKMRRRRHKHTALYYGKDVLEYQNSDLQNYNSNISCSNQHQINSQNHNYYCLKGVYKQYNTKISQQIMHRIETETLLNQIQNYISKLNSQCQEHFNNYSKSGEHLSRLKVVFITEDNKKKWEQFKEIIPLLK